MRHNDPLRPLLRQTVTAGCILPNNRESKKINIVDHSQDYFSIVIITLSVQLERLPSVTVTIPLKSGFHLVIHLISHRGSVIKQGTVRQGARN